MKYKIFLMTLLFIIINKSLVSYSYPAKSNPLISNINQIIPDFQVNENTGGTSQYELNSIMDKNGNVIYTWTDERNGDKDVFMQRYSSDGTSQGANIKVNDDNGFEDQFNSQIATNSNGDFVICWVDKRQDGQRLIYAQRFTNKGIKIGSNFTVWEDTDESSCDVPDISISETGQVVIVWLDRRNGNNDIYAQRYDTDGSAIGDNFKVNDDNAEAEQLSPAVAMDKNGNFGILWQDNRNGDDDIYMQCYNSDGTPSGSNIRINDDESNTDQSSPLLSANKNGNIVVSWIDHREGDHNDLYVQLYEIDGTPLGNNYKINSDIIRIWPPDAFDCTMDSTGNIIFTWCNENQIYARQYKSAGTEPGPIFIVNENTFHSDDPSVSSDDLGNFVITWRNNQADQESIQAQQYNSDGTKIGNNIRINDIQVNNWVSNPVAAMSGNGNFAITWHDYRNGDVDLYSQIYTNDSNSVSENIRINDDQESSKQWNSAIAVDNNGNFVITWRDDRVDGSDTQTYAQRFSSDGTALGENFKVDDHENRCCHSGAAITCDGEGNFIITWSQRDPYTGRDIYARIFNQDGTALDSSFRVNDNANYARSYYPAIASDSSGNFVITWYDPRNDNNDIFAQRFAINGTPLGSNFRVNDDLGVERQRRPAIAMKKNGDFIITWYDYRNGDSDIYAQRYNSDGTTLGVNFRVNDDTGNYGQSIPEIAMDGNGNFVIVWMDYRNDEIREIYAQRFDSLGTAVGNNFQVCELQGTVIYEQPSVSMDIQGNFVITWQDSRNNANDVYAQRYDNNGSAIGQNYRIPAVAGHSSAPDVILYDNRIYTTWTAMRTKGTGWDIMANVLEWDHTVRISDQKEIVLPTEFKLSQNFPNPFNPTTTISYQLPEQEHVELVIYNIKGEKIRTLINSAKTAGFYNVEWNGTNEYKHAVASGIYIYSIKAGQFSEIKRMVFLK